MDLESLHNRFHRFEQIQERFISSADVFGSLFSYSTDANVRRTSAHSSYLNEICKRSKNCRCWWEHLSSRISMISVHVRICTASTVYISKGQYTYRFNSSRDQ